MIIRLEGYSDAELTSSYAIISNACIQKPFGSITAHEKTRGAIKAKAMKDLKMKDFYCINTI